MRGMIRSVEKSPNGMLVLNIGGIKFRCYQELEKLGAEKKDIVVHDNDPRFTGTIIWIRKVPQSQQPVKAFNLSDNRMIKTAATKTAAPRIDTLKNNKKNLTDEERARVMEAKAIWHHGPKGEPSPAVWKSEVDGETWFVTNTHRAFQAEKTLDSAIEAFHGFIKTTAAKGDPTGTNLYVLKQYFEQADEIPNGALKPVDVPHMRRCLQTGLIEVVGGRGVVLRLTKSGRQALGRV
jgi:hypothetical protein